MVSALPLPFARVVSYIPPKQGTDFPLLTLPLHWAVEGAYCSIVGVRTPEILSSPEPGAAAGLLLSQFPLRPITNKALEGKEYPKTIGFKRKPPKRRLWRMKRGGFEEVSRFPCHNVAGNRLTRRCKPVLTLAICPPQ